MAAYSRRDFLKGSLAAGAGVAALGFPNIITAQGKEPIKFGVLHSLSGTRRSARFRCATSCSSTSRLSQTCRSSWE